MTVGQIIQEIDKLPAEDRQEVLLRLKESAPGYLPSTAPTIRYASKEDAKRVSAGIFDEYADLFRKLAQ